MDIKNVKNIRTVFIGFMMIGLIIMSWNSLFAGQQVIFSEKNQEYDLTYEYPACLEIVELREIGDEIHDLYINVVINSYVDDPINEINVFFDSTEIYSNDEIEIIDPVNTIELSFNVTVTANIPSDINIGDEWIVNHRVIVFMYDDLGVESYEQYEFKIKYIVYDGFEPMSYMTELVTVENNEQLSDDFDGNLVIIIGIVVGLLFLLSFSNYKKIKNNKK